MTPPRAPSYIESIAPYAPGKPIEEVERELGLRGTIKLASNENPLGPSPRAAEALHRSVERIHRYPDGGGYYLRERIAALHGLPMEQVMLGNGSTELVELFARTFLGADGNAVISEGAFIMYRIAVSAVNGHALMVPLRGMKHDLAAMAAAADARTRLLYIANPNNPTGTYSDQREMEAFFEAVPADVLVVLDEAYCDYIDAADYPQGLAWLRRGRNVAVLRTFSKIHGLAGLRIGYALTTAPIARSMEKVRSPFNTSAPGQEAALAALDDEEHVRRSREMNRVERGFVESALQARRIPFTPTVTNFVLIDVQRPAQRCFEALLRRGVIVRPVAAYNFPTSLRVTIGTRRENERFLEALDDVIRTGEL